MYMKKIENFQVAFYDKDGCYDEDFYEWWDTSCFDYIFYNDCHEEYRRLFVNFDDGMKYEVKLEEYKK